MKYHIDKNGNPAVCRAVKRPCPLGGDDVHFATEKEAQDYADNLHKQEFGIISNEIDVLALRKVLREAETPEEREAAPERELGELHTVSVEDAQLSMGEIHAVLEDYDIELTDNIDEAIYLFSDGSMIDGFFSYGIRSEDHNLLASLVDDKSFKKMEGLDNYTSLHIATNVVRLVPETKTALIMEGQDLTDEQEYLLAEGGYDIETYIKKVDSVTLRK